MFKPTRFTTGAVAALAAIGLGGAAIAAAAGSPPTRAPISVTAPEATSHHDGDNVQSGDQTTPDAAPASRAGKASSAGEVTDPASQGVAGESSTSETAGANDGPGGHADEPGNANANTEQQGQN